MSLVYDHGFPFIENCFIAFYYKHIFILSSSLLTCTQRTRSFCLVSGNKFWFLGKSLGDTFQIVI